MKTIFVSMFVGSVTVLNAAADPRLDSWLTAFSGQYARVYTNEAMLADGATLTSWSNGSQTQPLPAYCGAQEIYSSSNWVYARSTGLASYNMGPWQNGAFPNLPVNQKWLYRFPRAASVPATKTATQGGAIGIFVDGVAMFNSWDAFYWNGTSDVGGGGSGYWNRDAYVNEGPTFDPGNAHQQNTGTYHYHANPIALRYLLGDHVDFDDASKTYSESTNAPAGHSPILAWTSDGYPLYGPYGYSNPTNPASGLRRMISGYVIRNGQYGTSNLTASGRTTIPQWAARLYNASSNQAGPAVSGAYPLGRYMEDNDYLGDHGYTQGVDYDLDEYNGRQCVTPEFPNGTYAYFVSIAGDGSPAFPYNIGRGYYGSPVGGTVASITESVATNFLGNTNLASTLNSPTVGGGMVTLTWSALEGGSYQVEAVSSISSSNAWTVVASGLSPNQIAGAYSNAIPGNAQFYRVARTSVAPFDPVTVSGVNANAPGGSASDGQTVLLTITLPDSPPWPPSGAPITTVTVGSIACSNVSDSTQGVVQAQFTIPAAYPSGAQNVVVTFHSPGPTYTLTGGFTVN